MKGNERCFRSIVIGCDEVSHRSKQGNALSWKLKRVSSSLIRAIPTMPPTDAMLICGNFLDWEGYLEKLPTYNVACLPLDHTRQECFQSPEMRQGINRERSRFRKNISFRQTGQRDIVECYRTRAVGCPRGLDRQEVFLGQRPRC